MAIVLGDNQYGKAEVRVVRVVRDTARHEITDLNVSSQLRGDLAASHLVGDNGHVVATDTQKNTVYAFAKKYGVTSPEDFLITLGRHFVDAFEWISGGRWAAEQYSWQRILVGGVEHDHSFVREGQETRTAVVELDGEDITVVAGLTDLVVLKTTGSEFHGFPRDIYTTLAETNERILATKVSARWRYLGAAHDYNGLYTEIRARLLDVFAETHSLALQQTLYAMGETILREFGAVAEIKFSLPNRHHFLVDLAPFGLENPNEVFYAADRPYGLIEATVLRDDVPPAERVWAGIPGFC
ncbi:factor-independent urate hydroxylase [Gryllotalpicola protaetiae]|uniref:Uricase n=1 Tax=Gryllotalpicola protaetiae TaxID=2419771 RepID=A0A387BMM3_9MICO|nr:urate oxidase [Gryllotalpicola protaetiae]AYG02449.1 urate oxidase [Gryllotalpicola protaetiae]